MNLEELLELEKIVNEGKAEMCWIAPNRKQVKELIKMSKEFLMIKNNMVSAVVTGKSIYVAEQGKIK